MITELKIIENYMASLQFRVNTKICIYFFFIWRITPFSSNKSVKKLYSEQNAVIVDSPDEMLVCFWIILFSIL